MTSRECRVLSWIVCDLTAGVSNLWLTLCIATSCCAALRPLYTVMKLSLVIKIPCTHPLCFNHESKEKQWPWVEGVSSHSLEGDFLLLKETEANVKSNCKVFDRVPNQRMIRFERKYKTPNRCLPDIK